MRVILMLEAQEKFFVQTGLLRPAARSARIHKPVLTGSFQLSQLQRMKASSFCAFSLSFLSLFLTDVCKLLTPSELQLKLESDANPQWSATEAPLLTHTLVNRPVNKCTEHWYGYRYSKHTKILRHMQVNPEVNTEATYLMCRDVVSDYKSASVCLSIPVFKMNRNWFDFVILHFCDATEYFLVLWKVNVLYLNGAISKMEFTL